MDFIGVEYAKIPCRRRTKFGQTNGNQSGRGEIECLAFEYEYIIHAPGDRNGSYKGRPVITVKALLEENNIISLRTAYVVVLPSQQFQAFRTNFVERVFSAVGASSL
jgi:hypothetical protein